ITWHEKKPVLSKLLLRDCVSNREIREKKTEQSTDLKSYGKVSVHSANNWTRCPANLAWPEFKLAAVAFPGKRIKPPQILRRLL
ncbi:unnamed protein product, partial [Callosobruchus maculatus]